ncbi:DUF3068 domain-containing protein [Williamsia sp. CHRR-6]|uniref:DUF3068 domain-containing protein n=1 Tax=Williamsia sp. CHRR-6 TaxID=2835871 RepID=UPI001BDABB16|nr:DUF3068 domain-containing protein [Williamsia sp. CHRR-6]MBT0567474.1 DUF3068 domain-containing protein [Williamsia sp. CHRR-6]
MASGRLSVKELVGPVLIFVGALLLVVAIALPLYLVGQLKKAPMDTDYTTVSAAQRVDGVGTDALPAQILNPCSLTSDKPEVSDAALTRQQRVVAVKPAGSSKITYQAGTSIKIDKVAISGETVTPSADASGGGCLGSLYSATKDRVTTDRTSGEAKVSGGGSSEVLVDSADKSITIPDRKGLQYRFPFDAEKKSGYLYFDLTTRTSSPLKFVDTAEVSGVKVNHYRVEVPEADLGNQQGANGQPLAGATLSKPAAFFGGFPGIDKAQALTANLFHKGTYDLYVDPKTGTIINTRERIEEYYKFSGISDDSPAALRDYKLTKLDVTFAYDQKTQESRASAAKDQQSPITLWGRWLPILFGVLGLVALIGGIVVLFRSPATAGGGADDDPYYPVATPDDANRFRDVGDAPTTTIPNLSKDTGGTEGGYDEDPTQNIPRQDWTDPDKR